MGIYFGNKEVKEIYYATTFADGIYRNSSKGLITIGVGDTTLTMSDKNLGAISTNVNSGDSYGNYYQWGNNYGFSLSPITTTTRVDASSYGPGNYYNGSSFITTSNNNDRSTVRNDNLRGDTTNTDEARRGPCDEGYHIMSKTDMQTLQTMFNALTGKNITTSDLQTYFKFPFAGYLSYVSGSQTSVGTAGYLRTSSSSTYSSYVASTIYNFGVPTSSSNVNRRGTGYPIRPFKNEVVIPDSTRTKLY